MYAVGGWAKGAVGDLKHNSAVSQHKFVATSIHFRLGASILCLGKQLYAVIINFMFGEKNVCCVCGANEHFSGQNIIRLSHSINLFTQA